MKILSQYVFWTVAIAVVAVCVPANVLSAQEFQSDGTAVKPAAIESVVLITAANSRISFIGTHVGDDPKPRLGGFTKFKGYAKVDSEKKAVTELAIDIQIDSVWTQFGKLTTHLLNADFFEADKFPSSQFVSTKIEATGQGQCTVTGDLTLHGQTQSISFPATFRFENGGLSMTSKFNIDRSLFGMDQMLSGVEKSVALELVVGQKTVAQEAQAGHGGDTKKKQSNTKTKPIRQLVSLKLPNMT